MSGRDDAIVRAVASAITPKLDEVRSGRVVGHEPSELQIARIAIDTLRILENALPEPEEY